MELPFGLGKKKNEDKISADDVYSYVEKNLSGMSKFLKEVDTRIKNVENGKTNISPPSPIEMRMSNMEQAIIALNNDLNNVANDHLQLKAIARYRKEFKHLQPPLPNVRNAPVEQSEQPEQHEQVAIKQPIKQPQPTNQDYVVEEDEADIQTQIPKVPTQEPQRVKLPKLIR